MKKGILFDMGETLVHNLEINFKNSLLYIYDLNTNKKVNKTKFINDSLSLLMKLLSERKLIEIRMSDYLNLISLINHLQFDVSLEELEVRFALISSKMELIPDVTNLLEHFKNKGYPLILLSNTSFSKKAIIKMLDSFDLTKYFDEVIVSSESLVRKPEKAFFDLGISKFKDITNHDIYYIGNDFNNDIIGATNASIYPIWFNEHKVKRPVDSNVNEYIEISKYTQLIEMDF